MSIGISGLRADGTVKVGSTHTAQTGEEVQRFAVEWRDLKVLKTEYAHGLSIIHDVKDHVFYGLSFTPFTEIQTIVQTYYGRELSRGRRNRVENGDFKTTIREHVFHELFGKSGRPLVYDQSAGSQAGLLDLYAPRADEPSRLDAYKHMCIICEDVMLPRLAELYATDERLCLLQASPLDQPELYAELLDGIRIAEPEHNLLRLSDNLEFSAERRAFVDEKLARVSAEICGEARAYATRHELVERFGRTFDTTGYTLP